ncbi:MAG: hypothetical protein IPP13_28375 [Kouleothrix sp.]|jgi:hypothetical protein|nr:hypothetical protein [Kouleothrix sp.]
MPTLRKVAPDTGDTWQPARTKTTRETPPAAWLARPATLFITTYRWRPNDPLSPGDVLRVSAGAIGVVIEVRADGGALLAMACGGERWAGPGEAMERLGRVKGISRIDQAKKMLGGRVHGSTHAWFARVYDGTKTKAACSFSDAVLGGRRAALRAALAYHAAHVGLDASEGIAFI